MPKRLNGPPQFDYAPPARPPLDSTPDDWCASQHRTVGRFDVRRSTHDDLLALSLTLTDEFSGRVAAGTVLRVVAVARERLLGAGVRAGLVVAVESMARAELDRIAAGAPTGRAAIR